MNQQLGINKRIADKLLEHGYLDDTDHATAVEFARRKNLRVEEALLQLALIDEPQLLKYVATLHKTQFVSTERMSKAKIDRQALAIIPKKLAEHFSIYPLVLDRRGDKLIVATADPDDADAIKELKLTAGVQRVLPMVARPGAVRAAISRGYEGDRTLFQQLLRSQLPGYTGAPAADDPFEAAERRRQQSQSRVSRGDAPSHPAGSRAVGSRPGGRRRLQRTGPTLTETLRGSRERSPTRSRGEEPSWPSEDEAAYEPRPVRGDRTGYPGESYVPNTRRRRSSRGHLETYPGDPPELPRRQRRSVAMQDYPDYDGVRRGSPPPPPAGRRSEPRLMDLRHADAGYREADDYYYDEPAPDTRSPAPRSPIPRSPAPHSPAPRSPAPHSPNPRSPNPRGPQSPRSPQSPRVPQPPRLPQTTQARRTSANATPQVGYGSPHSQPPRSQELGPDSDGDASGMASRPRSLLPPRLNMAMVPSTVGFSPVSERGRSSDIPEPAAVLASAPYTESLRVLIGLLERDRPDLRAHSSAVARLSLSLCERIALPNNHTQAIVLASYLHDLGKMGSLHLTALNVALSDPHRALAAKLVAIPQQLMESVGLTGETTEALAGMYEQMGGGGLPEGLSAKEIPMGARILAVTDSFADLTRNANNAHGVLLTSEDAIALMRQHAGTVFDANILDVLEEATGGERILTDLLANRHRVLLVDCDPEETMVLQLRMVEQGFDVHVARNLEEARGALSNHEFALVVSEIDLEQPDEGFVLLQEHAQLAANLSWVFLSGRETRETAERAFKLQADDFLTKPVATEVVVAKLTQLIERKSERVAPHGVSGSLSQMGLPDIIQILFHGRKTCALVVSQGELDGAIHFSEGRIVNAIWGDIEGENAVYRLLAIEQDGNFRVDPEFVPEGEPVIHTSPEGLLLEGMRLLDEGAVP